MILLEVSRVILAAISFPTSVSYLVENIVKNVYNKKQFSHIPKRMALNSGYGSDGGSLVVVFISEDISIFP